jgi:SAM-dependent methyltransferase
VTSAYDDIDFEDWLAGSSEAAAVVVSQVLEAVTPHSVVDVGCGLGAWLAVFREHGVEDILGYDGPWIDRSALRIAPGEFRAVDLSEPLTSDRRFELAVCLEVAHLLEPSHGDRLVESLASLAPVVLFSAGIPGQGGINHLNEQWPRYWADRFASHGYVATDPFRAALWEEPEVKWWFAQNLVCYADPEALGRLPVLEQSRCPDGAPLALVHPGCFLRYVEAASAPAQPRRTWWRRESS